MQTALLTTGQLIWRFKSNLNSNFLLLSLAKLLTSLYFKHSDSSFRKKNSIYNLPSYSFHSVQKHLNNFVTAFFDLSNLSKKCTFFLIFNFL